MDFKRRGSIRFTLMALIIATAMLIIAVFAAVFGLVLVDAVRERGRSEMVGRLQEGAAGLRQWLTAKSESVLSYVDIFQTVDTSATLEVFLDAGRARSARDPEMYELYFGSAAGPEAGGSFNTGSGWVPPAGWDWTGRPWYRAALAARGVAYSDPYVDANTGELVFTVSAPAYEGSQLVGVVGADIYMTTMDRIVSALKPSPSAQVHLIDSRGLYITNEDTELIQKLDFLEANQLTGVRDALFGADLVLLFPAGTDRYLASVLIPELGWRLVALGEANDILGALTTTRRLIALVSGACLLVAIVMAFILLSRPVRHIRSVATGIAQIAAGGADLTQNLPVASRDEVGELAWRFNEFINYLDDLLRRIMTAAKTVSEISLVAKADSARVEGGIGRAVGALGEAIELSRQESEELRQAASTAHRFFDRYRSLQSGLLSQAASVEETAAAMNQISNTMGGVAQLGKRGQELAADLDKRVKQSAAAVNELIGIIADIDKRSEAVAAFADVISEVAERTNLLAMNAAIEAAHAGSSGKGFAVVADEIRKLAESSSGETDAISKTVSAIRQTIARGASLSKTAEGEIIAMVEALEQSRNVSMEISGATEEEARAGQEILKALRDINDVNMAVKSQLDEQSADLEAVETTLQAAINGGERMVAVVETQGTEIQSLNGTMADFAKRMESVTEEAERLACLMASFTLRDGSC